MRKTILTIAAASTLLCASLVSAMPITMQFTASGFTSPLGAPTDPVIGIIKYDAVSPNDPVSSFTSIDLTIAGHTYSVGELEFLTPDPSEKNHAVIGKKDANQLTAGTNDFLITYFLNSLTVEMFGYTIDTNRNDQFFAGFVSMRVTPDAAGAVPGPATGALLGLALIGLAAMRRRRAFFPTRLADL